MPKVVRTIKDLRKTIARWRAAGESVALVPTMGALHAGHVALVEHAGKKAGRTVVSIFVNPAQFAPNEDLARYPRDEAGDLAKLARAGADLVWAPDAPEIYPPGFATRVQPGGAAEGLEGAFRPHHFGGVATVCLKLFTAAAPDIAVFGEKDYQQLCVIRQMVRDLHLPLAIAAHPTVREGDGLALSSRNAYLTAEERAIAPALFAAISAVARDVTAGVSTAKATSAAKRALKRAGFAKIDYVEVREAETLARFDGAAGRPGRVLAAAWLGKTRLIDNVAV